MSRVLFYDGMSEEFFTGEIVDWNYSDTYAGGGWFEVVNTAPEHHRLRRHSEGRWAFAAARCDLDDSSWIEYLYDGVW